MALAAVTSARTGLMVATFGLGLGATLGVTRYLKSMLFDVQPVDLITFIAVGALLLCVAPAIFRRAARQRSIPSNARRAE
jgi:hypothetical protein